MSPHRLHGIAAITQPLRQAFAVPPESGPGVWVGLTGMILAHWNLHVIFLFSAVVIGGMIDLWTGARRARLRQRLGGGETFNRQILDDGISSKFTILIVIVFLGLVIDGIIALMGDVVRAELVGDLFRLYTPAMASLLAWRLLREIASIKENVEATPGGQGAIFPGVDAVINALRWRLLNPGGGALPQNRYDDGMSAEERAWIHQMLDERRRASDPSPAPPLPSDGGPP